MGAESNGRRYQEALKIPRDAITLISTSGDERIYLVASSNGNGIKYKVRACDQDQQCDCPDAIHRGEKCKHSIAVRLYEGTAEHDIEDDLWAWEQFSIRNGQEFKEWSELLRP